MYLISLVVELFVTVYYGGREWDFVYWLFFLILPYIIIAQKNNKLEDLWNDPLEKTNGFITRIFYCDSFGR